MIINLIVAYCNNRGIGLHNDLPWKYKKDMAFFSKKTKGNGNNAIIMGKNTFLSIGKILSKRHNIVLSTTLKQSDFKTLNTIDIVDNLDKAIHLCESKNIHEIFIIGGQTLYKHVLDLNIVDYIFITKIKDYYECDTFFPLIPDHFLMTHSEKIQDDDTLNMRKNELEFCTFQKIIQ